MTDFTPQEIAEKLIALGDQLPSYIKPVMTVITAGAEDKDAVNQAASYLRKIAAGEYKRVVHAHWEEVEPGHDVLFECSRCGRIISSSWGSCEDDDTHGNNGCDPTEEWLTCPSCGALMDGKDDSHV